jgi:peptidoglycan hydrolase-like amidase
VQILLLGILPDSVIVGIYGGIPIKEAVLRAGRKKYVVKAKGNRLLVNGVRRRRLVLKNVRLLKPIKGDYPGLFIVKPRKGGFIMLNKVPREEYIADVIASEMGDAPLEALKAQAVLARTFLMRWAKGTGLSTPATGTTVRGTRGETG